MNVYKLTSAAHFLSFIQSWTHTQGMVPPFQAESSQTNFDSQDPPTHTHTGQPDPDNLSLTFSQGDSRLCHVDN